MIGLYCKPFRAVNLFSQSTCFFQCFDKERNGCSVAVKSDVVSAILTVDLFVNLGSVNAASFFAHLVLSVMGIVLK
jgi:hypothetical protein